jgi:hypothetical protein
MPTGEKNFVKRVMDNLKKRGMKFQRHEDIYSTGIPDMSYDHPECTGSGWLEAKSVKEWPKRSTTTLKISHFTAQQSSWLLSHGAVNKRTFLLMEVGRSVFLVPWFDCLAIRKGEWTQHDFFTKVDYFWSGKIDYENLYWALGQNYYGRDAYESAS